MAILHTADLHLAEDKEENWAALDELVSLAGAHNVSGLVISGDLFDHDAEAEKLRSRLRTSLGGGDFQTVILPGNHDHRAYRSGLYFGENVSVINSWEEPVRLEEAVIWGLPYEQISAERLVGRLREMAVRMDPDRPNYLLFHGELLDAYFSREDMGDEGGIRYMPARLSYFERLPLQYVLAGHFHSRYAGWQLPGGGLFIYPGSPVAITRRETGIRKANLVSPGKDPLEISLNTCHYEEMVIDLDPFSSESPLAIIGRRLKAAHRKAKIFLTVQGFFNGSRLGLTERELAEGVKSLVGEKLAGEPALKFYDVRHIMEDDLFRQFESRLDETELTPDHKERVKEMLINAFRVVKT